jgi:hypothetical protein
MLYLVAAGHALDVTAHHMEVLLAIRILAEETGK